MGLLKKRFITSCGLCILLSLSPLGMSEPEVIYRWVDANGQVQYSDTPPSLPKDQIQVIRQSVGRSSNLPENNTDPQEQQRRFLQAADADRKERQAEADSIRQALDNLKKKCQEADKVMAQYRSARSLFRLDENGQQVTLSDEEKQQEELRVSGFIEDNCKDLPN